MNLQLSLNTTKINTTKITQTQANLKSPRTALATNMQVQSASAYGLSGVLKQRNRIASPTTKVTSVTVDATASQNQLARQTRTPVAKRVGPVKMISEKPAIEAGKYDS